MLLIIYKLTEINVLRDVFIIVLTKLVYYITWQSVEHQ